MGFNKKNLAAGVKEMRSVANRLLAWADDLEKAGEGEEAPDDAVGSALPAVGDSPGASPFVGEPAEAVKEAPPTRAQVKAFLTEKCAAGYAPQVRALIASFGASSLSEVPEESLGSLLDAALLLGEEGDGADAG